MVTVKARSISKSLGGRLILSKISFSARDGDCVGIVGPVGSGKTTLLHIITGLITPDKGSITINGLPPGTDQIRQYINFASSNTRMSGYATVFENLYTYAKLYGVQNPTLAIQTTANLLSLPTSIKTRKVYTLSAGENSLVNVCKALLNNPDVLIFDEITSHLDRPSTNTICAVVRSRTRIGKITIFASHQRALLAQINTKQFTINTGSVHQTL